MSIEIRVTDPANTSPNELGLVRDMIDYFIANNTSGQAAAPTRVAAAPALPIHPNDNPETGTEHVSPGVAFGAAAGNPAAAFVTSGAAPVAGTEFQTGAGLPASSGPNAAPSLTPNGGSPAIDNGGSTAGASVTVDKTGLPYDTRIHAKGANGPVINADGTWRGKRGVDPAVVAQVTAELRAAMAAPGPAAAAATLPTLPNVPPGGPGVPAAAAAFAPLPFATLPGLPTTPSATGTAAPIANPTAAPAIDFIGLVGRIGQCKQAGKLNDAEISAACGAVGLADLTMLPSRPDLVGSVATMIEQFVAQKG